MFLSFQLVARNSFFTISRINQFAEVNTGRHEHEPGLNEIKSFKKFQVEVERKLCLLEDTINTGKEAK